jgi:protein SYS1
MTGLGVWSCRWRELRPISFGGGPAASAPAAGAVTGEGSASTQPAEGTAGGDEEQGFGRGRGRGRGRDGGGEYEMVGLNKEGEAE